MPRAGNERPRPYINAAGFPVQVPYPEIRRLPQSRRATLDPGSALMPYTDEEPLNIPLNMLMTNLSLPTVSARTLDWLFSGMYPDPESRALATADFMRKAKDIGPADGVIPIIGQKPEQGGALAIKLLTIPGERSPLYIRFYPGGHTRDDTVICFDLATGPQQGMPLPRGYSFFQRTSEGDVDLKGLQEAMGYGKPTGGDSFLIIKDTHVILRRPGPGNRNFTFETSV
ncbi:hypothetical protein B0H16DRAFT_1721178 [Mycena metata]|uniref:Uncharacterized protein n=1 Tax=Mycena metata TaxID=1033252 RepID=A0AAD7J8G6_9AGAR|nr:hypothetical protein B0H16DRAFT_1721178 [Mycena metata]